ncbi:MAG: hypothetical protein MK135_14120 [Polyangiaceae bacterium]|nr:hypothetical protein [Polyangiaceae bacterium]
MTNHRMSLISLAMASLMGCSNEDTPRISQEQAQLLVQGVAEQQLSIAVQNFSEDTEELATAAKTHCVAPSEATLVDLRLAWATASQAWYQLQLFNFGPATADIVFPEFTFIDSLRLRGTDYTETILTTQENWLNSDEVLTAEFFSELRFQYVGLLSTEVSFFAEDGVAVATGEDDRICQIAMGLSTELASRAEELRAGWLEPNGDSGASYLELLVDNELPDGRDHLVALLLAGWEYADYLEKRSVVTVAGQLSQTSWSLLAASVGSLRKLLEEEQEGKSIVSLMQEMGANADATELGVILSDLSEAVEKEDVLGLNSSLASLVHFFRSEIPLALGIDLGLTITDGD